ncbi:adenine-specific methyltransferase EcoRI family protein [Bacteroides thetaiotaomicron]|nr:adenine-specific methyltransferase EcoRI family protein [Bacteroides thetaiotaomicron]
MTRTCLGGKTVLLPCDDPEWSNFTRYFAAKFDELGLKKTDFYELCSG